MKYKDIVLDKFHFTKVEIPESFEKLIWELDFPDYGEVDGEVRYRIENADKLVTSKILDLLSGINMEDIIWEYISEFKFDINRMRRGEWVPMHNERGQKSPFEVVLWLTRTDIYQGREFIMVAADNETRIQPTNGLVCFLDTTVPDVYHGVSKLLSDTEIITITGGLGRKK